MRLSLILLFSLILHNCTFAQAGRFRSQFQLDTIMIDESLSAELLHRDQVRGCIYRERYYQAYNDSKKNTLSINTYNLKNRDLSQNTLFLVDSLKIDSRYKLYSLTVNDKYAVVGFQNFAYIFKYRYESNRFVFDRIMRTEHNYNFYKLSHNTLVCASTYNASGMANDKKFHIATYNLNDLSLQKSIYPQFDCIEFSHFSPNHWVDVVKDKIIITNTCTYKVQVYNLSLEPIDSLLRKPNGWTAVNQDMVLSIRKENLNPRMILDTFSNLNKNLISRVEGVWALNDSTSLIRYFNPGKDWKDRYFDIYNIRKDKLQKRAYDLVDVKIPMDMTELSNSTNNELWTWNYGSYFGDNYVVVLKPVANISYVGKSQSDIQKEEDNFLKENDPVYSIWVFRYKGDD